MRFPAVMVASVWASMVGKKDAWPTMMGGMSRTARTLAHPHNRNIANSQFQRLVLSITLCCVFFDFDKLLLSIDGSIGGLFLLVKGY